MADKRKRKHGETRPRWRVGLWSVLLGVFLLVVHYVIARAIRSSCESYYYWVSTDPSRVVRELYIGGSTIVVWILSAVCFFRGIMRPRINSYFFASFILAFSPFWLAIINIFNCQAPGYLEAAQINGLTYRLGVVEDMGRDRYYEKAVVLYECDDRESACQIVEYENASGPFGWDIDYNIDLITVIGQAHLGDNGPPPYVVFQYQVE